MRIVFPCLHNLYSRECTLCADVDYQRGLTKTHLYKKNGHGFVSSNSS